MTTHMTPADIIAAATAAAAARDGKTLKSLWTNAVEYETTADRDSVTARVSAAVTLGEIIAAAVVIDSDGKQDLHTCPQLACQAAAARFGITVSKDHAKRLLRANLYCQPERLAAAVAKLGTADGPKNGQMIEVVRYCQTQDSKGRAALGEKFAGLTPAAARKAVSKGAAETAAAAADAARIVSSAAAVKLGQDIIAKNDDTVFGPLTASQWVGMNDADLKRAKDIIAALEAARKVAAAAKREADKGKGKGKAATETPAAPAAALVPGTDEFNAAVAAAVAATLAAAK